MVERPKHKTIAAPSICPRLCPVYDKIETVFTKINENVIIESKVIRIFPVTIIRETKTNPTKYGRQSVIDSSICSLASNLHQLFDVYRALFTPKLAFLLNETTIFSHLSF